MVAKTAHELEDLAEAAIVGDVVTDEIGLAHLVYLRRVARWRGRSTAKSLRPTDIPPFGSRERDDFVGRDPTAGLQAVVFVGEHRNSNPWGVGIERRDRTHSHQFYIATVVRRAHLMLRPASLLPAFSQAFDAPLWPLGSLPWTLPPGAPALAGTDPS
jgi:hypothetical protein